MVPVVCTVGLVHEVEQGGVAVEVDAGQHAASAAEHGQVDRRAGAALGARRERLAQRILDHAAEATVAARGDLLEVGEQRFVDVQRGAHRGLHASKHHIFDIIASIPRVVDVDAPVRLGGVAPPRRLRTLALLGRGDRRPTLPLKRPPHRSDRHRQAPCSLSTPAAHGRRGPGGTAWLAPCCRRARRPVYSRSGAVAKVTMQRMRTAEAPRLPPTSGSPPTPPKAWPVSLTAVPILMTSALSCSSAPTSSRSAPPSRTRARPWASSGVSRWSAAASASSPPRSRSWAPRSRPAARTAGPASSVPP